MAEAFADRYGEDNVQLVIRPVGDWHAQFCRERACELTEAAVETVPSQSSYERGRRGR